MAGDSFDMDVIIRLATLGAAKAKAEIGGAVDALDKLSAEGRVSEKVSEGATRAFIKMGSSVDDASKNLPRLRYALFDVSNTIGIAGAAMTGLAVAAGGMAISMDRAFADVLRTSEVFDATSSEAANLRHEFEQLFMTMPTSWAELTEIGTLAGQLNIAKESVGEFTQLVAMFAATTDVSVEQAATAFGRLSQLLDVPDSELQNLGSSILAVGVNSVATESQIIAISTQITSMASTAGFSADQVFGLSAALASLGTAPELSRGVITRLFTNITVAINEGSDRLEAFGRVAGMTGQQFATAWGDDAAGALTSLAQGLGNLDESQAVSTLKELGITAARDVPTLLRLAQNSEVLAESLQVAAQGYADGTALADQYNVISSTVAEKLNVLANNFQLLVSNVGAAAGGIGFLVDGLIGFVQILNQIADNPVAATVAGVTVAVVALAGVFSLLSAGILRGVAGLIAFRTVTAELTASGFTASASLSGMASSLYGVATGSTAATAGVRAFSVAMKLIPGIGIALSAAAIGFEVFGRMTESATDKAERFFGSISGFNDAIRADNAPDYAGKVFGEITVKAPQAAQATDDARQATETWLGVQSSVPGTTDTATNSLRNQTVVLGENADAWLRNSLASNEAFQNLANNPAVLQTLTDLGFNIDSYLAAGLQGGGALDKYLSGIEEKMSQRLLAVPEEDIETWNRLQNEFAAVDAALYPVNEGVRSLGVIAGETANTNELLGLTASDAGNAALDMADAMNQAYSDMTDAANASIDLENAIFGLGQSLFDNGAAWDYYSEAGRANMGALLQVMDAIAAQTPGDAAATASALQGLFDFIVQGGYASAQQLSVLSGAIASLSGGKKVTATAFNPQSFYGGWEKSAQRAARASAGAGRAAKKGAREAAKEIRTLVDYANDLEKVFNRAFDLRFSSGSTLDKVTSQFIDIREATEASARSIQKLKADIQGLQSDLSIQQYFLSVAVEYGDTKRAEAIQANIAKIQADLADKTASLSDEQSKNSKELTGNSKAAIDNRAKMEALVKSYQDHLVALASSGMSQADLARKTAELRQQFIAQAVQLGYSRVEVERYAGAFDDMRISIERIPRNVTVTANTNPALQALNEFVAQARKAGQDAGNAFSSGLSSGVGGGGGNPFGTKAEQMKFMALYSQAIAQSINFAALAAANRNPYEAIGQISSSAAYRALAEQYRRQGGFAEGGYTGAGGKYEPAGVVHRGEYVIPKKDVNQATGLPYADALGRLQRGASGPGYANGGYVRSSPAQAMAAQIGSLGPMAVQQFQLLLNDAMRVNLDGRTISQNSAQQYAQSTAQGAN